MERYRIVNGKKLRYGYTTGSCATAAVKAAAMYLKTGEMPESVVLMTPKGWEIAVAVCRWAEEGEGVAVYVIKDSGDDPDITHQSEIGAYVALRPGSSEITLVAGEGVGTVTKPGLAVAVGEPAINPVPRQMITTAFADVLGEGTGAYIEIRVPQGRTLAERTFNPKLGIEGGISIIGTSGIVEPMSEEALKETLFIEMRMAIDQYDHHMIFSPGNYGHDFAVLNGLDTEPIIKVSNFAGEVMDQAEILGVKRVLWIGHVGKLVKVAGGIYQTHSKVADGRMDILAARYMELYDDRETLLKILGSITVDDAISYIPKERRQPLFDHLATRVSELLGKRTLNNVEVATVLFSQKYGWLGQCDTASDWIGGSSHE